MFARETLFDPLGIGTVYWQLTAGSHYQTGGGLQMTPRDMARLGYLMLQNGTWQGQQIVPAEWVERSTRADYSVNGCFGYGYQWWILPEGQGYQASGLYDQRIIVLPEADMVVVFTANIPEESIHHVDGLVHGFILPACTDLAAEPPPAIYDAHGLTLKVPGGFCLAEAPIPGRQTLSDRSGLVQVTSNVYPPEILLLLWHELEPGTDGSIFLEAYLAGLAETGVEVAPGESLMSHKGGQALALQFSELTIQGISVPAISGAWICPASDRALAMTYLTATEATSEELRTTFERYLEGVTCH
jgi:hypothetical protein